jgi:predicted nucleic acid-binding protein
MAPSVTLDTGALIGIERGTTRMQALLDEAGAVGATFNVPAGVLAQAWRGTPRQARLGRFLNLSNVAVVPLDDAGARAAGVLGTRSDVNDVVDASVVVCARLADGPVVTTDPYDLRRLDPQLRIVAI